VRSTGDGDSRFLPISHDAVLQRNFSNTLLQGQFKIKPDYVLFFSVMFMSVAGISDMTVCVGRPNLHSINTFSNAPSLMTYRV